MSLQNVFARYPRNALHIVTVNCGAHRQGTTASVVFAVSLSQVFFNSVEIAKPRHV
jgi:hypothetical protein